MTFSVEYKNLSPQAFNLEGRSPVQMNAPTGAGSVNDLGGPGIMIGVTLINIKVNT